MSVVEETKKEEGFFTNHRIGVCCGIVSGILWGFDTVFLNESYNYEPLASASVVVGGASSTMIHDTISAGIIIIVITVLRKFAEVKHGFSDWGLLWMFFGGIAGACLGMLCYNISLQYLSGGFTAAISCLYPAVGAFLAFVFLKDRIFLHGWIGLFCAIVGTVVASLTAVFAGGDEVSNAGLGILFSLLCVLGWGSECVIADYSFRLYTMDSNVALLIRQLTSAVLYNVIIIPALSAKDHSYTVVHDIFAGDCIRWIAAASACGTFSYLFYYHAILLLGATQAIALNITYAIWTIIFGFIFDIYPDYIYIIIICIVLICVGSFVCSGLGKEPRPVILLKSWFDYASEEELKIMKAEQDEYAAATAKEQEEKFGRGDGEQDKKSGEPEGNDVEMGSVVTAE